MKARRYAAIMTAWVLAIGLLFLFLAMTQSSAGALVPSLVAAASADNPTVTAVDPDSAPNDLDTPVVITGTGFAAVLSGTLVMTPPLAYLGDTALEDVIWVNTTTLSATVPWGLEPGVYTLTVVNPDGGTGRLPDAFTVTQGIGVWTTNGPYGGGVGQLVLHPVTPTTVYALGSDVGVFISEDAGNHWEMVFRKPSLYSDFAFDAQNPDVIYVGDEHGLYRTMDGTQTWEPISIRPGGWWKHDPAVHPTLPGVVFAAVGSYTYPWLEGGVFRSNNYGNSWITLTVGLTDTHFTSLAIHPSTPQTMLAGTESGNLYYSLNGGQSWNWATQLTGTVAALYFNPFEPLQAWATTDSENGVVPLLYKSEDLVHWAVITVDEGLTWGGLWDMDFLTDTIWATTNGAYFSTDGGENWTLLNPADPCGGPWWLAINPQKPQEMYGAPNIQGVCKSEDGGLTWRQSNDGLAALKPLETAVSPADPDTIYVRAPGLHLAKSENGGRAWRVLNIGITPPGLAVDPFMADRVYMSNMLSEDGGDTWHLVTFTLPITWSGWGSEVTTIAPHPSVPGRILAGLVTWPTDTVSTAESNLGLLCASDDYGEHWIYLGPTQPISYVTQIAHDAENPNLIYAATGGSGLWKSTDGGLTWNVTPHPEGRTEIHKVFTHPNTPNLVYAFTNKPYEGFRLFISYDAGETWIALPDGAGGPFYFAPTQSPSLYSACFFNNLMYLCRSWDGGYTWEVVNEVQQEITTLAGGSDGERVIIYVGTKGGTVSSVPGMRALDAKPLGVIPGRGSLLGAGIYRLTVVLPTERVYLPLVSRGSVP